MLIATGGNNLAMRRMVRRIAMYSPVVNWGTEGSLHRVEAAIDGIDPGLIGCIDGFASMRLRAQAVASEGTLLNEEER